MIFACFELVQEKQSGKGRELEAEEGPLVCCKKQ